MIFRDDVELRCKAEAVLYRYFRHFLGHTKFWCSLSYDFCNKDKVNKYKLNASAESNDLKSRKILEDHLSNIFKLKLKGIYDDSLLYTDITIEDLEEIITLGRFI